jgi:hypothetical protein
VEVEEEAAEYCHKLHGRHICDCEKCPIEYDFALEFISAASVDLRYIKFEIVLIEPKHLKNV